MKSIISLGITGAITYFFEEEVSSIKKFLPAKDQYIGTCLLSFIIAVGSTWLWNRRINESEAILNAVERIGNELELLFAISVRESQLIQITLKMIKYILDGLK